jgi:hypothetical protein
MNIFNEVLVELLGSYKLSFYIAYFIFVGLGIVVSLRISALKRDRASNNTPYSFSIKFLIQDNLLRILGSFAFVFLSIRLGVELFNTVPEYYTAVIMGLGFDQVLLRVKKLQDSAREKLK